MVKNKYNNRGQIRYAGVVGVGVVVVQNISIRVRCQCIQLTTYFTSYFPISTIKEGNDPFKSVHTIFAPKCSYYYLYKHG